MTTHDEREKVLAVLQLRFPSTDAHVIQHCYDARDAEVEGLKRRVAELSDIANALQGNEGDAHDQALRAQAAESECATLRARLEAAKDTFDNKLAELEMNFIELPEFVDALAKALSSTPPQPEPGSVCTREERAVLEAMAAARFYQVKNGGWRFAEPRQEGVAVESEQARRAAAAKGETP